MKKRYIKPMLTTQMVGKCAPVIVAAAIFLLPSCKRTDPPADFNDPVFTVHFEIDSSAQSVSAGLNDVYLFTRYDLNQNLFRSYNYFSKTTCPAGDCPGSLGFEFTHLAAVDTAFFPGDYRYALPDSAVGQIQYFNGNFQWTGSYLSSEFQQLILDGSNPLIVNHFTPDSQMIQLPAGVSFATFSALEPGGVQSIIHRKISDDAPDFYPLVNIKAVRNGNTYSLTAVPANGVSPYKVKWSNQDTSYVIHIDSLAPTTQFSVTVTDAEDQTADASLANLPFSGGTNSYQTANFKVSTASVHLQNPIPFVAMQWVDANGLVWRTDRAVQPANSYFHITSYEQYEPNENGVPARKLTVEFKCTIFNPDGGAQVMKGSGVVAMARP